MTKCSKCIELESAVTAALERVADLTRTALEAFRKNRPTEFATADRQVENAIGAKERAVGALREHRREQHGSHERPED